MNRFKRFVNPTLRRNLGLVSMTILAAVYTVPRVGSDTKSLQSALFPTLFPAVVSQPDNMPGWDLANIDNARVESPAKAGGLWQFVSETGKRYGLVVNKRLDERNTPDKATDAALSYLSDLHNRFGSWYLAAAAYNTGENRVGRIMREVTGSERGTDGDYYRISALLPKETQDYVPMIIAAGRISKHPERYGFVRSDIGTGPATGP